MKGKFQGFENLYVRKTHFSKNFSLQNVVYGKKLRELFTLFMIKCILYIYDIYICYVIIIMII